MESNATEWARIWAAFEFAVAPGQTELERERLVYRADRRIDRRSVKYMHTGESAYRLEAFGWALVREAADRVNRVDPSERQEWATRLRERLSVIQGV